MKTENNNTLGNRKLNAIWAEQRETNKALKEVAKVLATADTGRFADELKTLCDVYTELTSQHGNLEAINTKELVTEIAKLLADLEKPVEKVEFPEIQKIAGKVDIDFSGFATQLAYDFAKAIEPLVIKEIKITNLPDKQEIFGKALVRLEDNTVKNPVYVALTDGKKLIDLSQLGGSTTVVNGGGGVGITPTDLIKSERYEQVGNIIYVGEAEAGTLENQAGWLVSKYDVSNLTSGGYGKIAKNIAWTARTGAIYV